ncbi:MAG: YggT family protein [Gammaproteobacteria bacterium]
MGGNYLVQAAIFLIEVVFGLYILAVLLRFLFATVRADFHNPLSQFIVKITNPPLTILRRFIPSYMAIDWAAIFLLFAIQAVEIVLTALVVAGVVPAPMGLLVMTFAELLKTVVYLYIVVILVQVAISWINPHAYNPLTVIMHQLTEPVMKPARRLIPPAGGFDWSPLVVLIVLNLAIILLVSPIADIGQRLLIR